MHAKTPSQLKNMDGFLLALRACIFCGLLLTVEGCSKDLDCDDGQHCCKSHCTSVKIRCSQLCSRDEECSRDQLCTQQVCVACSKRYNCEIKSCFNDSNCPTTHQCSENHMCSKSVPPKHTFTLLPFIIIIAVLGFALLVLCYTEGCWKELFLYIKRHSGRYGTIALDECEADRMEGENERGQHVHTSKSCVNRQRHENMIRNTSESIDTTTSQQRSTSSPPLLRSTQVISHQSRTLVMAISQAIENQSRLPSHSSGTNFPDSNRTDRNSGAEPLLSPSRAENGSNTLESPPTYLSLFNGEYEEPPPKYEEVVNVVAIPVSIEMRPILHGSPSLRNTETETETTV